VGPLGVFFGQVGLCPFQMLLPWVPSHVEFRSLLELFLFLFFD
jgi:hypothetical protein